MIDRIRVLAVVATVALSALSGCAELTGGQAEDVSKDKTAVVIVDPALLPSGNKPRIPWLLGAMLHRPSDKNDRGVNLGKRLITDVAVTKDRIVTRTILDGPEPAVEVRDLDGAVLDAYPDPTSRLATNAKRTIVAWVDDKGVPRALQDGVAKPLPIAKKARGEAPDAVAVAGDDCRPGAKRGGCSVFYTVSRDNKTASIVASTGATEADGTSKDASKRIAALQSVSPQRSLAGLVNDSASRLCSVFESKSHVYRTCSFFPRSFSPDGTNLLGASPEVTEGPAVAWNGVLTAATGKPVITARSPKGSSTLWDAVWEDDSHYLTLVVDDPTWAVMRVSLDGRVEAALGPFKEGDPTQFHFAVQP